MQTGVVIGRFQVDKLHEGHIHLLQQANKNQKLVVILGESDARLTSRNPLSFDIRAAMIKHRFGGCDVIMVKDINNDIAWSQRIDDILIGYENPILYHSRDSFAESYVGEYPTKYIKPVPSLSGSTKRDFITDLSKDCFNDGMFRRGVIWAANYKYPTAFSTVDVGVLGYSVKEGVKIILGRKPGHSKWCLPGGFIDPSDESMEAAGRRECREEIGHPELADWEYVTSKKINDSRYRGTRDGIITTLFICKYVFGHIQAGDDLEEVQWFTFEEAEKIINENHLALLQEIKKKIKY